MSVGPIETDAQAITFTTDNYFLLFHLITKSWIYNKNALKESLEAYKFM